MRQAARVFPQTLSKSRLDRSLSLFTDVRPGEGATAALMFVNILVLLCCYSVIKTVREPLILLGGGAEVRSYAAAGQALTLMGFVPLYSWIASRVDRLKLIVSLLAFFIVVIELFFLGARAAVPNVGFAFFIFVGIFSLASIAQFWAYANDLYPKQVGDRLFPLIAIGATAGSPVGSWVAEELFKADVHLYNMLHITVAILVVHLILYWLVNRREASRAGQVRGAAQTTLGGPGGFSLVFNSPYLRLIALLLVLLNLVNTTSGYIVGRMVV